MKRVASGLLVAVALWPVVPLVLHRVADVDPWKLMSFAMYAVPPRPSGSERVEVFVPPPPGWTDPVEQLDGRPVVPFAPESEDVRRALASFANRRATLGHLVTPQAIAPRLFEVTGASRVFVSVRSWRLRDGRFSASTETFVYDRE
jgi:hypothetical protein